MTTERTRKELVILSAKEFYLQEDHGLNWTDDKYDSELDSLLVEEPDFNIFDHLEMTGRNTKHKYKLPQASKVKIHNKSWLIPLYLGDLKELAKKEPLVVFNYQGGNLKYVSLFNDDSLKLDHPIYWLPEKVLDVFPKRLNIRSARLVCKLVLREDKLTADYFGILEEPELGMENPSKVRMEIVKCTNFGNSIFIKDLEDQDMVDKFKLMNYNHADAPWLAYKLISPEMKFSPKMDGCSGVAYYKKGILHYIATRGDDNYGKNKTEYFRRFLPENLHINVDFALMFENVIDLEYEFGWNSRQKANGLTNSRYKIDEVAKYSTFMVYDAFVSNGTRFNLDTLNILIQENSKSSKFCSFLLTLIGRQENLSLLDHVEPELVNCLNTQMYMDSLKFGVLFKVDQLGTWTEDDSIIIHQPTYVSLQKLGANMNKYSNFNRGVMNGYLFTSFTETATETDYIIFDVRDLKPKMLVVDEFSLEQFDTFVSTQNQSHYVHSIGAKYLIDGVVIHHHRENPKTKVVEPFHTIYKYAFNEMVESVVTKLHWDESKYGSLIPIVEYEGVVVEGSWMNRAASGGLNNLVRKGLGVGAKVNIVRTGSTIPHIISVGTPAEPKLPNCPHCKRQLTWEDDVYGEDGSNKVVKCSDPDCEGKIAAKSWFVDKNLSSEEIQSDLENLIKQLIPIEGYPKHDSEFTTYTLNDVFNSIKNNDFESFNSLIKSTIFYRANPLQLRNVDYSSKAAFKVLYNSINK